MNDFQIRIDEPIHWLVIVLAVMGLVSSLLLVYRRFYPRNSDVSEITLDINSKALNNNKPVSYTHLTLPTIYSV